MNSPSRSLTHSIKGRIWIAAGALATVNCVVGLGSYLAMSFLSADPLIILVATFLVSAGLSLAFGWWLAADVLRPLESVTFIARSLERSPSASLPRTTGAIETDQLLQTLHRSGQQLKNLISLMDDVSAGKVEAASMPLESSDRLSASFQRLVSKVTDSISAKRDLDEFRLALNLLSDEISGVRNGKVDLSLRSEHPQTKEVRDALRFLSSRLAELTRQVFATGSECERTAAEARTSAQKAIDALDERTASLPLGSQSITESSSRIESLLKELAAIVKAASEIYDPTSDPSRSSQMVEAASRLRSGFEEATRSVQKLRSRSALVSQSARSAGDLAKRSNLLALNASIVTSNSDSTERLLKEMESLAAKAEEVHRQLVSSVESLNSEIAGFEKGLSSLSDLSPQIDKVLVSSVRTKDSLMSAIDGVAELESKIRTEAEDIRLENGKLVQVIQKISDVSSAAAMVRETESRIQRISGLFENLRDSVSDLHITTSMPAGTELPRPQPAPGKTGFDMFVEIESQGGEN